MAKLFCPSQYVVGAVHNGIVLRPVLRSTCGVCCFCVPAKVVMLWWSARAILFFGVIHHHHCIGWPKLLASTTWDLRCTRIEHDSSQDLLSQPLPRQQGAFTFASFTIMLTFKKPFLQSLGLLQASLRTHLAPSGPSTSGLKMNILKLCQIFKKLF